MFNKYIPISIITNTSNLYSNQDYNGTFRLIKDNYIDNYLNIDLKHFEYCINDYNNKEVIYLLRYASNLYDKYILNNDNQFNLFKYILIYKTEIEEYMELRFLELIDYDEKHEKYECYEIKDIEIIYVIDNALRNINSLSSIQIISSTLYFFTSS